MSFNWLDLNNNLSYQKWKAHKIAAYENSLSVRLIKIEDAARMTEVETSSLLAHCNTFNYAIYALQQPEQSSKRFVCELGERLGLNRLDGNLCADEDNISSIQVQNQGRQSGYIPYTNRKLTWHTDGYYNKPSEAINAMILHCVQPALSGGDNWLLDHEMAYIQLRDECTDYVTAFKQAGALTIPANIENGVEIRAAQSGPVFSYSVTNSALHMRFSARTRNIEWKNDALTQEALACMNSLLTINNPYVTTYRLKPGEGIIANNVLHNRNAFEDGEPGRLLYRARYYDRIKRP